MIVDSKKDDHLNDIIPVSEEMLKAEVESSGYRVFRKDEEMTDDATDLEVTPACMTSRDAFFSLMAIKMMNLSQKYGRKLEDLHDMFYTVSCDWSRLEKVLQDSNEPLQWTVLEDLAVRDERDSEAYRHVVEQKG